MLFPLVANAYTLHWTEPTTRADGTALYPEEIVGYLIYVDGRQYTIAFQGDVSKELDLDENEHTIQMQTLDSGQRFSDLSEVVRVPLANPDSPDICVAP